MKNNIDEILPIGTVLKVKKSELQYMIAGYNRLRKNVYYDYVAVIHPTGLEAIIPGIDKNIFYFNREDIEEVYFIGFLDDKVQNTRRHIRNIIDSRRFREERRKNEE